jgi:hypothetical protein
MRLVWTSTGGVYTGLFDSYRFCRVTSDDALADLVAGHKEIAYSARDPHRGEYDIYTVGFETDTFNA